MTDEHGRRTTHRLVELLLMGLIMAFGVIVSTFVIAWGFGAL